MPTNGPTMIINHSDGIIGIESDGQQTDNPSHLGNYVTADRWLPSASAIGSTLESPDALDVAEIGQLPSRARLDTLWPRCEFI